MNLYIYRHPEQTKQTKGLLDVVQDGKIIWSCKTLELPWLNNQKYVSCIPEGDYTVFKWESPTYGTVLRFEEVPGRSDILIHQANYAGSINPKNQRSDLMGCIAPGLKFVDLDGDGLKDITSSKVALDQLLSMCPDKCQIRIETAKTEDLVRNILS